MCWDVKAGQASYCVWTTLSPGLSWSAKTEKQEGWNWQGDREQATLVTFVASLEQPPLLLGCSHETLLCQSGTTKSSALWDRPAHPPPRAPPRATFPSEVLCPTCTTATNGRESKGNEIRCGEGSEISRVFHEHYLLFARWTHCPDRGPETLILLSPYGSLSFQSSGHFEEELPGAEWVHLDPGPVVT